MRLIRCNHGNDSDKEKWSEKQIAKATEHAAKEYWESIKNMTSEEFLLTFPDWANNPILNMTMDPSTVQALGLQVLHEYGGLGEHLLSQARRYTAEQIFEVYGTGAIGGSLGRYPKSQAVWNISTHPKPPTWQFWRRGPEIIISCSLGEGKCVYGVQ